jgi:hypothetical protein
MKISLKGSSGNSCLLWSLNVNEAICSWPYWWLAEIREGYIINHWPGDFMEGERSGAAWVRWGALRPGRTASGQACPGFSHWSLSGAHVPSLASWVWAPWKQGWVWSEPPGPDEAELAINTKTTDGAGFLSQFMLYLLRGGLTCILTSSKGFGLKSHEFRDFNMNFSAAALVMFLDPTPNTMGATVHTGGWWATPSAIGSFLVLWPLSGKFSPTRIQLISSTHLN